MDVPTVSKRQKSNGCEVERPVRIVEFGTMTFSIESVKPNKKLFPGH